MGRVTNTRYSLGLYSSFDRVLSQCRYPLSYEDMACDEAVHIPRPHVARSSSTDGLLVSSLLPIFERCCI